MPARQRKLRVRGEQKPIEQIDFELLASALIKTVSTIKDREHGIVEITDVARLQRESRTGRGLGRKLTPP